MSNITITAVVGSIQSKSINRELFNQVVKQKPDNVDINLLEIKDLPLYNPDVDTDYPAFANEFKDKIKASDAILFVTPEYTRTIPAALKNAIEWGSRPYGTSAWADKPAGILGATMGNVGTFGAQHHLRQMLTHLHMYAYPSEFYFSAAGKVDENYQIIDDDTKDRIDTFWTGYIDFINKLKS